MSYVELAELCIGSLVGLVEGSLFYYMAIVFKGYEFDYVTGFAFMITLMILMMHNVDRSWF